MLEEFISKLSNEYELNDPASTADLIEAEKKLEVSFPDELQGLLAKTNGIQDELGTEVVWPLRRIVEDNLRFRSSQDFLELYMPFQNLLFFGDAGNGDQFAFPINGDGAIQRDDVFAWNHEEDSRTWIAPSLSTFLDWWASGKINL